MSPRLAFIPLAAVLSAMAPVSGQTQATGDAQAGDAQARDGAAKELSLAVGTSLLLDYDSPVQRLSMGNGDIAEALPVSPKEVVINGKAVGATDLYVWDQSGNRKRFNIDVRPPLLDAARRELASVLKDQDVTLDVEGDSVVVLGTVKDLVSADRAMAIAGTLGKPVNLLNVVVPPVQTQVLLKVRFANVDRTVDSELGANLMSTGAGNTIGRTSTGQFSPPQPQASGSNGAVPGFTFSDALNVFLFRPDLNLAATIRALQARQLVQILAEPNVLAIDGKRASFLVGGEFPFPTLQGGGAGIGQVTIQFREFGIRLSFLPRVTPRGTIRLEVAPEVSSLDYANGLTLQGFTVPGLDSRKIDTEIELEDGQSFAIAGLLDNRVTENLNKIPGLGDIPILGNLFKSRTLTKNNTELLVLVTPELVRPIPAAQTAPAIKMPMEPMKGVPAEVPQTPGVDKTGPVPVKPPQETVPIQQLMQQKETTPAPAMQLVPVPMGQPPAAGETGKSGDSGGAR